MYKLCMYYDANRVRLLFVSAWSKRIGLLEKNKVWMGSVEHGMRNVCTVLCCVRCDIMHTDTSIHFHLEKMEHRDIGRFHFMFGKMPL